jgi:mono/diheme cytochrome c family protein
MNRGRVRSVSRPMPRRFRTTGWVWGSALALGTLLFVACGGGSSGHPASAPPSTSPSSIGSTTPTTLVVQDAKLSAADFKNVNTMTRVGDHFVANVRGHLAEALAVAHSAKGGNYPVGTIIQLVPQEAMVKRAPGFSPATKDWEFFSLDTSANGTKILSRGGAKVLNRFGGSCASCHAAAQPQFDMVCGTTHGCAPLPIGPDVIAAIQKADPRPKG